MYGNCCENLLEILAVVIIQSPISLVCGAIEYVLSMHKNAFVEYAHKCLWATDGEDRT